MVSASKRRKQASQYNPRKSSWTRRKRPRRCRRKTEDGHKEKGRRQHPIPQSSVPGRQDGHREGFRHQEIPLPAPHCGHLPLLQPRTPQVFTNAEPSCPESLPLPTLPTWSRHYNDPRDPSGCCTPRSPGSESLSTGPSARPELSLLCTCPLGPHVMALCCQYRIWGQAGLLGTPPPGSQVGASLHPNPWAPRVALMG